MGAPITLTAISGGINRLRTKGGADKNSLFDLLNGYVTQAGTVKVREGTYRNANIATYSGAGNTKGLMAYQGELHVFANAVVPVPPGYALHVLGYPQSSSLTDSIAVIHPAGDPLYANVALLMTFDGVNGAKGAVDISNAAHPITFGTLNAALSTTAPKFGTASAHFLNVDGFGKYGIATDHYTAGSQLDIFATATWTIEFWFRVDTANSAAVVNLLSYGSDLVGGVTSEIQITASVNTANNTITASVHDYSNWGTGDTRSVAGAGTTGTWHHFALVANGGTPVAYLDGVGAAMNPNWVPAHYGYSGDTHVVMGNFGRASGAPGSSGNMDELRVTAGVARYTGNFTPTTVAFPANIYLSTPPALEEINFSAPYLGGIYVSATFDVTDPDVLAQYGDTFHYWIQSSEGSDTSNEWQADTNYVIGDVVIPTTVNGLTYIAGRRYPANPVWAPNVGEAVNNIVEPTAANGFKYTVTAVLGAKPTTGFTEPTWPTGDGAIVNENSAIASDQTVTRVQPASNTPTPAPPARYSGGIAGGFGQTPS